MHSVTSRAPIPEVIRSKPNLYRSCIDGAVSIDDYKHMMMKERLTNIKAVDYSKHTKMALDKEILSKGLDTLKGDKAFGEIVDFAQEDSIGYALLVGTKPKK